MSNSAVSTNVVLLLVMVMMLLAMVLLLHRVLKLIGHTHLHVSLVARSSIHHDMLCLLVLIKHPIWIMGRRLGYRRARR